MWAAWRIGGNLVPTQRPMHDGLDLQLAQPHADALVRTASPRRVRKPVALVLFTRLEKAVRIERLRIGPQLGQSVVDRGPRHDVDACRTVWRKLNGNGCRAPPPPSTWTSCRG